MDAPRSGWQAYAMGSALFAGLTAVLAKVGVAGVNSNLATFIRTVVILVVSAAIVTARGEWEPMGRLSGRSLLFLVVSGVATGLSWLCYFRALHLGEASSVAPVDKLSVVFAVALAALFLGERLVWQHWVGGSLIVAGAVVIATK